MKFFAALFFLVAATRGLALTERELDAVGRRVWQNECAGTRDGLTSWNEGEGFASLGIGHFIWYPAGARGPFEDTLTPRTVSSRCSCRVLFMKFF